MKRGWHQTLCLFAAVSATAAPPTCRSERNNGVDYENCERADVTCGDLVKEALDATGTLKPRWNGCLWPVLITKSRADIVGVPTLFISVTVVPSWSNSDRADITVFNEFADGSVKPFHKNVQFVIKDGLSSANIQMAFPIGAEPSGVPTVQMIESGGTQQATHQYR